MPMFALSQRTLGKTKRMKLMKQFSVYNNHHCTMVRHNFPVLSFFIGFDVALCECHTTHTHGTCVEWYTLHIPFSIFELYQSSNCVIAGESYTDEQTKHSKVTEMRISYSPSAECQTHTHTAIHHKHSTNAMPTPWLPQNTHTHRTSVEMQFTHFHICHAVSFAFAFVVCFPFVLEDHARAFSLLECTGFWNVSYMK